MTTNKTSQIDIARGSAILDYIAKHGGNIKGACDALGCNYSSGRRSVAVYRAMQGESTPIPDELDGGTAEEQRDADIDDLLALAALSQAVRAKHDPTLENLSLNFQESTSPIAILLAGCMQTGGRWTSHEFIRRQIDTALATPNMYIGFFGDDIENFRSGSFAGAKSVYDQALKPDEQRDLWELFLDKVGQRALWGMWSQHGTIWDEKDGANYIKRMYTQRGIPFFDGMGYIKLHVGRQTYQLAASHEFPGSSMYNPVHAQKRALWQRFPNADILAMADRHQYAVLEEQVYGHEVAAGNRLSPSVYLVQIGTAKSGLDPYTMRGWERGKSEWPILVLFPDVHEVFITRHIGVARALLAGQVTL